MSLKFPALFLGHGNPMNALQQNRFTEAWSRIARETPRPSAILAVSAHWYVMGTGVTVSATPQTIHDFGGFPKELYEVQYPAPGAPELARRVQQLLAPTEVSSDDHWGLDHGTWSVLAHLYPEADVPVVQLSIDAAQPPAFHFDLGRRLAPLREEGVLILGSGNLVHNLRAFAWGNPDQQAYDWAARFEEDARRMLAAGDYEPLLNYHKLGRDALLSVPTPEHFLPLLYVIGAGDEREATSFPVEGVDGGSISMLAVQVGR